MAHDKRRINDGLGAVIIMDNSEGKLTHQLSNAATGLSGQAPTARQKAN
jgi:hypothetical protein